MLEKQKMNQKQLNQKKTTAKPVSKILFDNRLFLKKKLSNHFSTIQNRDKELKGTAAI
jgi:hypothetical protein